MSSTTSPGLTARHLDPQVRQAYPGPTWDRLAEIKRRYDPTNLFRRNQNIAPADGAPA
jgi:FAD/FMN-containing dehydrogenase